MKSKWERIRFILKLTVKSIGKRSVGRPDNLEDNVRVDRKEAVNLRTGLIWLRIGIIGEPL